jgi:hypothetical protein
MTAIQKNTEEIIKNEEKIIKDYGNEQLLQRTTILNRDGNQYRIVSDIVKKKINKNVTTAVAEHMQWKKFGKVKNQKRGNLEPGIVDSSKEEIHIINRKVDIEQDLADKFKDSIINRKNRILTEIKEQKDKENKEKLEAFSKTIGNKYTKRQTNRKSKLGVIKIAGYNPNFTAEQLTKVFLKIGKVKSCVMFRNCSYIRFEQTLHAKDAVEMFDNKTVGGCVLRVTALTDNN